MSTRLASSTLVGDLCCSGDSVTDMPSTDSHRGNCFLDIPVVDLSVAARLNPRQGVEPRSGEISLAVGKVNIQVDVLQRLLKAAKERRTAQSQDSNPATHDETIEATGLSGLPLPPSASSQTSRAWRSPISPVSPFMDVLSVSLLNYAHVCNELLTSGTKASMRWKWAAKHSVDLKHPIRRASVRAVRYLSSHAYQSYKTETGIILVVYQIR